MTEAHPQGYDEAIYKDMINLLNFVSSITLEASKKRGGLEELLESDVFQHYLTDYTGLMFYGNIDIPDRMGYAFRQSDLGSIPHGLLSAEYARFPADLLPNDINAEVRAKGIASTLQHLMARTDSDSHRDSVKSAIKTAARRIFGQDDIRSLEDHARSICDLGSTHPDFERAAVMGDPRASALALEIADRGQRRSAIRIWARQRVIWNAADVHRVAARGRAARTSLIPPFMQTLASTGTASGYLAAAKMLAHNLKKYSSAQKRNETSTPDSLVRRIPGPKNAVMEFLIAEIKSLQVTLNETQKWEFFDIVPLLIKNTEAIIMELEKSEENPFYNYQAKMHNIHFAGLSEFSALFVTAYRFAQDENEMIKIIENPDIIDFPKIPEWPSSSNNQLIARSDDIFNIYRKSVLRNNIADDYTNSKSLAKKSKKYAEKFLLSISNLRDSDTETRRAATESDLSHESRRNSSI